MLSGRRVSLALGLGVLLIGIATSTPVLPAIDVTVYAQSDMHGTHTHWGVGGPEAILVALLFALVLLGAFVWVASSWLSHRSSSGPRHVRAQRGSPFVREVPPD